MSGLNSCQYLYLMNYLNLKLCSYAVISFEILESTHISNPNNGSEIRKMGVQTMYTKLETNEPITL
jgi:hypothetical protein